MTEAQLINYCISCAIRDRQGFLDAMRGCQDPSDLEAIADTKRDIQRMKALYEKRKGKKYSVLPSGFDNAVSVDVRDILRGNHDTTTINGS